MPAGFRDSWAQVSCSDDRIVMAPSNGALESNSLLSQSQAVDLNMSSFLVGRYIGKIHTKS